MRFHCQGGVIDNIASSDHRCFASPVRAKSHYYRFEAARSAAEADRAKSIDF
jgi:hypothetical protein